MLVKKIIQEYKVFRRSSSDSFPFLYQKDEDLSGKPLEEIEKYLGEIQIPFFPGEGYSSLKEVHEKKGKIIYSFIIVPAIGGNAKRGNFPSQITFYKIVPKLKLVEGRKI